MPCPAGHSKFKTPSYEFCQACAKDTNRRRYIISLLAPGFQVMWAWTSDYWLLNKASQQLFYGLLQNQISSFGVYPDQTWIQGFLMILLNWDNPERPGHKLFSTSTGFAWGCSTNTVIIQQLIKSTLYLFIYTTRLMRMHGVTYVT